MKHLTAFALIALLSACNPQDIQGPQSALKTPESPEVPAGPEVPVSQPRDLYAAYETFDTGALVGGYVDVRYAHDGGAAWTLQGFSIRAWTDYDRGQIDLLTDGGLETYYFTVSNLIEPFTAQVTLKASVSGAARMTVSPIVWVSDTEAQVTVCSMSNVCNTITQAYGAQ